MQSKFFQKLPVHILPSNDPISLIGSKWRCLESGAWEEEHHVFFGKSSDFCRLTISRDARVKARSLIVHAGDWIIENDDKGMLARAKLQIICGDYRHGVLLLDFDDCDFEDFYMVTAQLLTSCFVTQRLDILKVLPMNPRSIESCQGLMKCFERQLMTFRVGEYPEPVFQTQFQLERDAWFESEAGSSALKQLGWLQKRIQRKLKSSEFAQQKRKTPWMFQLLSMGRRRRRREQTIHPLDLFRSRL
jgi:hypothetical protein